MGFRVSFRATVAALLAAAICFALAAQASAAQKRYRDEVFKRVTVTRDIVYGSAPVNGQPQDLTLDLYQPKGDDATKRPVIIWVHGGGFCCGDKAEGPSPDDAREFAHRGYVTASINYRLLVPDGCTGGNGVTAECYSAAIEDTHDAQAAVRWMRANASSYKLDKRRIAIGGESAGAIVSCGVAAMSASPGDSGNPGPSSAVGAFVSISGGIPGGLFVDSNTAPGILFASVDDPIVPYQWSVDMRDAMARYDIPVRLTAFPGDVHVPIAEHGAEIDKQSKTFLYKQLDLAHAAQ
jgi:para-nitrobenzyl esterase